MAKQKEVGIPKGASKAIKKADEKMDKAKGVKEGSLQDLRADRAIMKKFFAKKAKTTGYGKKGK